MTVRLPGNYKNECAIGSTQATEHRSAVETMLADMATPTATSLSLLQLYIHPVMFECRGRCLRGTEIATRHRLV